MDLTDLWNTFHFWEFLWHKLQAMVFQFFAYLRLVQTDKSINNKTIPIFLYCRMF